MSAEEKRTLERTLLEKAKELLGIAKDAIPEGGHLRLCVWADHLSATITRPITEAGDNTLVLEAWADPTLTRVNSL